MALERGMSYFTTAKIINMAVIITMAMVRQRGARDGFLVTHRRFFNCSGIRGIFCGLSAMNWVRIQQIRRRNIRRDFLRTGFIGLPAAVGEPALSAGKRSGDDVRGGIVDWSISRRHVWLWTGSKTTKRGPEPRWQSTLRCGSGRTEESAVRERLDGYG
jgi:hypothetical protein